MIQIKNNGIRKKRVKRRTAKSRIRAMDSESIDPIAVVEDNRRQMKISDDTRLKKVLDLINFTGSYDQETTVCLWEYPMGFAKAIALPS